MRWSLFVVLSCLLLLVSCGNSPAAGSTPTDTASALRALAAGTTGFEVLFAQNFPPPTVYDDTELVTLLEVRNRGNHDLRPQDCVIRITGFDEGILRGFPALRSCSDQLLEGRSVYNLDGGFDQLELRSDNIKLPSGLFEYSPKLNVLSCYQYTTTATPVVCIDPDFYSITTQQKVCSPAHVTLPTGQGGPVGVSSVGVEMIGRKAVFEINVVNFQPQNKVLSPFADIRTCGGTNLEYEDFDQVSYSVRMQNSHGDCKPRDTIRLQNGRGKIVCTFPISQTAAYETPLHIELAYGILQSVQKPIRIVATPE